MICPNHKDEQAIIGQASDGAHIRPVLACGCTPSNDECDGNLDSAIIPAAPVIAPVLIDVPQFDPALEEQHIRTIVAKIFAEAQAQGIQLAQGEIVDGEFKPVNKA